MQEFLSLSAGRTKVFEYNWARGLTFETLATLEGPQNKTKKRLALLLFRHRLLLATHSEDAQLLEGRYFQVLPKWYLLGE